MADKTSHFGMAGHLWTMSEFLLRGWNVSVPYVDVGDDVLVIEDASMTIYRVQVKTREGALTKDAQGRRKLELGYSLSRRQLVTARDRELFYMLLARWDESWRFLLMPRDELADLRVRMEERDRTGSPGRRPSTTSEELTLSVEWREGSARGWGVDLTRFLNVWPNELAPVTSGPGSTRRAGSPSETPETPPAPDFGDAPPQDPSGAR